MLGKNKQASVNMKGNLSALGKLGEFARGADFSKNLLDMVNDLVTSSRREEDIIEYVKNLELQLERMIYLKETENRKKSWLLNENV